jgi:hypothetical protein
MTDWFGVRRMIQSIVHGSVVYSQTQPTTQITVVMNGHESMVFDPGLKPQFVVWTTGPPNIRYMLSLDDDNLFYRLHEVLTREPWVKTPKSARKR